jgi:threonine dehydratase
MSEFSVSHVLAARERIAGLVHRTPVATSRTLDALAGNAVFLKCENLQRGGSFKVRGAASRLTLLTPEERTRGVVAFSSGNHAQGVALAARELGVPATIVMPTDAPKSKVEATRGYGATVVTYDRQTEDREAIARRISEESGAVLVPPYDDFRIMAGQGTAALELFEDVPDLDVLLTPVGGGGLLSGCATVAAERDPKVAVYGVEAELADDTFRSFRSGERVAIAPPATIADGMRNLTPGELTFPVVQRKVTDILLVTDEEIFTAMRFLLIRMKLLVEPTGAVGVAALLAGKVPVRGARVGVVISGGNVDVPVLTEAFAADGARS